MVDSEDLDRKRAELEDIHIRIHELVFQLLDVFVIHRLLDQSDR